MRGELDRLVVPLGGAVAAGDEPGAVHSPEVAVHEGVAGLGLVLRPRREGEVPGAVLLPRVALEEGVLVVGTRLGVGPLGADDVVPGVDERTRLLDRRFV